MTARPACNEDLTVLYDGACPLCRREIGHYQGLTARAPVVYRDVSDADCTLPEELDLATVRRRFHVRTANGEIKSGARAFLALWRVMPYWRHLARLEAIPGFVWMTERVYRLFLVVRPRLQAIARRMDTKRANTKTAAQSRGRS